METVGEIIALSFVAAMLDAVRPLGIERLDMPLTPSRLWHAMQNKQ